MKILIVRVSAIGDVIHTLPSIFLIKAIAPEAQISWVVQEKAAALLINQPFLNHLWILPNKFLAPRNVKKTISILRDIRATSWDAIIDFQGLLKTSLLIAQLQGKKFGFDYSNARWGCSSLFTHHHTQPDYSNIIQKNLALASDVLATTYNTKQFPTIDELKKTFYLQVPPIVQEIVNVWRAAAGNKKILLICPNTTWPSKHWPLTRWHELIELLAQPSVTEHCVPTLVGEAFGSPASELAATIRKKRLPIAILPQWNLQAVTHLVKHSALVIGPDSGLIHLADFLGIQTIGIFGPTLAQRHGPFLHQLNQKYAIQVACSHHYKKLHTNSKWFGVEQNCMLSLEADTVFKKILLIMGL